MPRRSTEEMAYPDLSSRVSLRRGWGRSATWFAAFFVACVTLLPTKFATGASSPLTCVVGGTGSSTPLIRLLAEEFSRTHPDIDVTIMSPPLGSAGGLRALSSGRIDLAVIAWMPKPEESAQLGKIFELARTPFVFATRDGQRAQGFQLADLADVYAGRFTKWPNALPVRLILRSEHDAETRVLRSMSPDIDRENRNALRRKGMVIAENDLDAIDLIERIEGSLGTTTLGLVKAQKRRVQLIAINRVVPTAAALENGAYPWHKTLYVAAPKTPSPAALKFMEFVRSPEARDIMRHIEYLPATE